MKQIQIELRKSSLDSPCWIWTGARHTPNGYGRFINYYGDGLHAYAYKLVYETLINHKLVKKEELHHRCEVKPCVNPTHLELLTKSEHRIKHSNKLLIDGKRRCKMHPDGVINVYKTPSGGKQYQCGSCSTIRQRERRLKKQKQINP